MANPLARVMMDQMSKKNGQVKTENPSEPMERLSNLNPREEGILTKVIHNSHRPVEATKDSGKTGFRGQRVQLQDLVKNTSDNVSESSEKPRKQDEKEMEKNKDQKVKNPYKKVAVTSSVVANPGKGVSAVSLKSLGKGNPL